MEGLFSSLVDLDEDVYRNIVSLRVTEDLFDDLAPGDPEAQAVAIAAEMRVKQNIPPDLISRGFHYTCAIGYPFETQPFMATRYGDGRYGVWYGSLQFRTTIYETAFHTKIDILNIEGIDETVVRERAVYLVHCRALMIDLRGKHKIFPALIDDSYTGTQRIGQRVQEEGHPGLLAPSARCEGDNVVVFNPAVLSRPRLNCYLTYTFDPNRDELTVERNPDEVILRL